MKRKVEGSTLAVLKGGEQAQAIAPVCPYCNRNLEQLNWTRTPVGEDTPLTVIFCPYSDCRKVLTVHF